MAQYIDKSALVAEIERRISDVSHLEKASYEIGLYDAYKIVLSFIDTLEVKEVEEKPSDDLEEEIDKELHENWYGEYINLDKFRESANHFFELGLKVQKGE